MRVISRKPPCTGLEKMGQARYFPPGSGHTAAVPGKNGYVEPGLVKRDTVEGLRD